MNESQEAIEPFDFVGNWLCLDFSNTLHDRNTSTERDHFKSYPDLVWWSQAAGILNPDETQLLLNEAQRRPAEAALALQKATSLRETIYRIFSAIAQEEMPAAEDVQSLNAVYTDSMSRVCIVQKGKDFVWGWQEQEVTLERIVWDIARSAADLLVSTELSLTRECAGNDCSWLFLDTSKNHSRRWCDMKSCGNRAKVGKHYQRTKRKQA